MITIRRVSRYTLFPRRTFSVSRGTAVVDSSSGAKAVGDVRTPEVDPICRYIPTDAQAFLVEDHRLRPNERVTQQVSSSLPWMLFVLFATTPFVVMKYNLKKLSDSAASASPATKLPTVKRQEWKDVTFVSMPEILERRFPTFVCIYRSGFHDTMALLAVRELDRLFSKHRLAYSFSAFDVSTAPTDFQEAHAMYPLGHFVTPGGVVREFTGNWSLISIAEYILPESEFSQSLRNDLVDSDATLANIHRCVFKRRFAQGDKSRTNPGSLASLTDEISLDSFLEKCESQP